MAKGVSIPICLIVVFLFQSPAVTGTLPELPRILLDTREVAPTGRTFTVAAGDDFQQALNAAQPGDLITLQAGAVFVGPFSLPAKSGSGWIIIRTSAPDSSLPSFGTRITPAWASILPKIVTRNSGPALTTDPGAHHFRFVGVEFTMTSDATMSYGLVLLGDGSSAQTMLAQVPSNLVFDRVYVHGTASSGLRRGIALNSASTAIINSYVADVHEVGADTQAIGGWNGPGPFKLVNNYLEAAGENVLFGGADPAIPSLVPSDIEVRGNYFNKPLAWMQGNPAYAGTPWTVKNMLELKNAQRVLIDGNVFEHNWPMAQDGFSILFTVRNQDGTAPWSIVADIRFTNNIVRHVANGINILGQDDLHQSQQTQRVLIKNNLFDDVSGVNWGGSGRLFQVLNRAADITFDHNTGLQSSEILVASGAPEIRLAFINNLTPNNQYGVGGDGTFGSPSLTFATYFPDAVFTNNVLVGAVASAYPSGNFFPPTLSDVRFVNLGGADYRLSALSPYRNAATDGKDIGIDVEVLNRATAGAVTGTSGSASQAPAAPAGFHIVS